MDDVVRLAKKLMVRSGSTRSLVDQVVNKLGH
jgi:hypothetical protein